MKKLTFTLAFCLPFITSISLAEKTDQMKLYQIYSSELSLMHCKTPASMYFIQKFTGKNSESEKLFQESQTCANDLVLKLQKSFKSLDATLKTPEAKKALRDHYAATKVQLEAGVLEIDISEKEFNNKYQRLEEKRKEAWARLEIETL